MKATLNVIGRNTVALVASSLVVAACLGSNDSPLAGGASGAGKGSSAGSGGKGSATGAGGSAAGGSPGAGGSSLGGSGISSGAGGSGGASGAGGGPAAGAGGGPSAGAGGGAGRPPSGDAGPGAGGTQGDAGAPPAFIDTVKIFRWIASDIVVTRQVDQRFQRYLSLAHLLNAGASAKDMDLYRAAMTKAVNALSQGTRIVIPRAIDPYDTVFRVDIRDLEWDAQAATNRADKWEALVLADPYAIEYVQDDAQTAKTLTNTKVPLQSGNWLVFGGTQAPLYHDIVGIPATLGELERQLGTNIRDDIAREQVKRSGFATSPVAQQNRVIEHHDTAAGANHSLWITYDFNGVGGRRNVFSHPLDFQQDASEIIFSLPNGLHGYMIVDAAGNRLNQVDNRIEKDVSQRDGQVTNGISCVGCHDKGIIGKKDEVRDFVRASFEFDAQTKDLVDALYTSPDTLQSLVTQDSNAFAQQLNAMAIAPTVTVEPVSAVFHRFEQDVDLTTAATELGITARQLLAQLGRLNADLAPLETGTIKRDVFRARFAQTVCLLNVGIANDAACRR